MKKYLLLLLLIFAELTAISQTTIYLSGRIRRDSTLVPVVHHQVIIQSDSSNSSFNFYAVRYTGIQGYYDCTIQNVPAGVNFTVRTKDCDSSWLVQSFVSDTTQIIHKDFLICNNTPVECNAAFHFQPDSLDPLHIHFWDQSTPANLISSRYWTFGDGGTSTNFDPWHTYNHAGFYSVCLTITTTTGCTSTYCDSIHVGNIPSNCENWITYTSAGLVFTFEGHTHSPYPTTYTWTFGEGNTQTGQVVNHTFPETGSYNVTLHTVDSTGCEWTRTITVYAHSTFDLWGTVYLAGTTTADHAQAELFRVEGNVTTAVDTAEVNDSSGMFWFAGVTPGHYYIRAALLPSSVYYNQYVPTYYIDAVNWSSATLLEFGQPVNPYNIHMHPVQNYAPGNGTISGNITRGVKINGNGNPVPDVEVILFNENHEVAGCSFTDNEGKFIFEGVPAGNYNIYPEVTGIPTTPAAVTLDDSTASSEVHFTLSNSGITGISETTAEENFSVSSVFPDPVKETASVLVKSVKTNSAVVSVYDVTGNLLGKYDLDIKKGENRLRINASGYSKGIYYLRMITSDGKSFVRTFIK